MHRITKIRNNKVQHTVVRGPRAENRVQRGLVQRAGPLSFGPPPRPAPLPSHVLYKAMQKHSRSLGGVMLCKKWMSALQTSGGCHHPGLLGANCQCLIALTQTEMLIPLGLFPKVLHSSSDLISSSSLKTPPFPFTCKQKGFFPHFTTSG